MLVVSRVVDGGRPNRDQFLCGKWLWASSWLRHVVVKTTRPRVHETHPNDQPNRHDCAEKPGARCSIDSLCPTFFPDLSLLSFSYCTFYFSPFFFCFRRISSALACHRSRCRHLTLKVTHRSPSWTVNVVLGRSLTYSLMIWVRHSGMWRCRDNHRSGLCLVLISLRNLLA